MTVCSEYIQALEECHKSGLLARFNGKCNDHKNALNMCLRQEVSLSTCLIFFGRANESQQRKVKATSNNAEAKVKREKIKERWAEVDAGSQQSPKQD